MPSAAVLTGRGFQLCPDMGGHLRRIEIDEVSDAVEWYPAQLGPFAQSSDRRLFSLGEDATMSKADDIS